MVSVNMESEGQRDQQRNLKSSTSSELLKRIEEEAFIIRQEMSAQKETLCTFLLMDPQRRTRTMSSSVEEPQKKVKAETLNTRKGFHDHNTAVVGKNTQKAMETQEMEMVEFLELKSELLNRLEEETTSIRQMMKVQKDVFYTVLQMEPERRSRAIEILQRMSCSVEDGKSFMKNFEKATWSQTERERKKLQRTAEDNEGAACRKNVRILKQKRDVVSEMKNHQVEELQKEVERLTTENEKLRKALRKEREGGLRPEESLRKEKEGRLRAEESLRKEKEGRLRAEEGGEKSDGKEEGEHPNRTAEE
ncbi:reticulocyte-binding protein 2 homolog a-like [Pygocentrus nattereri]|uniref:reticulocyte-binding protein 2 homolog a-like n=1 Tax=Pygocentrus nattereri TaxID=42514 RepID=UPI0018918077|nr:reticulocyte-binding protein 2 homolog a-like [Pygocentrus nattereri]